MATDGKVKIGTEVDKSGAQKGLSELGSFAKKGFSAIATSAKAATAAIGATATGLGVLAKQAIESYADYEQLVGGVETLFKESQDIVIGYAEQAYETAGMSANAYMETVTSFSASLLQSLDQDTKAAADKANQALVDMSDNANKMGTDMEMIQNAYQGFAKQNYTMLDNLKLGYGGTKEEMQGFWTTRRSCPELSMISLLSRILWMPSMKSSARWGLWGQRLKRQGPQSRDPSTWQRRRGPIS